MTQYTLRVWAGLKESGRCKFCRQPVIWRVNATTGKSVPMNPTAQPVHTETDPVRLVKFDVFTLESIHLTTCRVRREQKSAGGRA